MAPPMPGKAERSWAGPPEGQAESLTTLITLRCSTSMRCSTSRGANGSSSSSPASGPEIGSIGGSGNARADE